MALDNATILKLCKFANIGISIAMIVLAFVRYGTDQGITVTEVVWTFYWIIIGLIMILCEWGVKFILEQFGFLKGYCGRGLFIVLMGTLLLNTWNVSLAFGIIFIAIGMFYIYINNKIIKDDQLPAGSAEGSPAIRAQNGKSSEPAIARVPNKAEEKQINVIIEEQKL